MESVSRTASPFWKTFIQLLSSDTRTAVKESSYNVMPRAAACFVPKPSKVSDFNILEPYATSSPSGVRITAPSSVASFSTTESIPLLRRFPANWIWG